MQDTKTKAKNLINRLRALSVIARAVTISPPAIEPKTTRNRKPKPPKKRGKDFYKAQLEQASKEEKKNLDFYRLQKLLEKKIKSKGLIINITPINTKPKPKPKGGIMDNIGNIFETSVMPAKPTANQ